MDARSLANFGFHSGGRFRIFPTFEDNSLTNNIFCLSAVSSQIGVAFFAQDKTLKFIDSAVYRKHVVTKENFNVENVDFLHKTINFGQKIYQLKVNCDGTWLAIIVENPGSGFSALIFDVRCFHSKYTGQIFPFCQIRLPCSAVGCPLVSFEWNTGLNDIFACCSIDGTVSVIQIHGIDRFTVQAVLNPGPGHPLATCLSWSPKGKQLVVGYSDCTLIQYKPNLQPTKKIDRVPDAVLGFMPFSVIDVCWLSTTHFAAVYRSAPPENRVAFCHVTVSKDHPPVFVNLDDICFGSGQKLLPKYYILHIIEWKILICCSSNSVETAVVGWNSSTKTWENWILDEEERAELPLDQKETETFPIGVALDLGALPPESPSDNLANLQAPVLILFSTDGLFCPFRVSNRSNHNENISKPVQNSFSFNDIQISKAINLMPKQILATEDDIPPPLIQRVPRGTVNTQNSAPSFSENVANKPVQKPEPVFGNVQNSLPANVQALSAAPQQPKQVPANVAQHQKPPQEPPQEDLGARQSLLLRQEINKTVNQLNEDLAKLKAFLKPVSIFNKAEEQSLLHSSRVLSDTSLSIEGLSEEMKTLNKSVLEISKTSIENRINAERCRVELEKRKSLEGENLWRERPLANSQEKTLNHLKTKIKDNDSLLNDTIEKFGSLLIDTVEKRERPKINSMELAYRTLTNMQSIIILQRQRLADLQQRNLHKGPVKNEINTCSSNFTLPRSSELTKNQNFASPNANLMAKKLTYGVDSPLKRLMQTRNHVPRRVSTPSASVLELSLTNIAPYDEEEPQILAISGQKMTIDGQKMAADGQKLATSGQILTFSVPEKEPEQPKMVPQSNLFAPSLISTKSSTQNAPKFDQNVPKSAQNFTFSNISLQQSTSKPSIFGAKDSSKPSIFAENAKLNVAKPKILQETPKMLQEQVEKPKIVPQKQSEMTIFAQNTQLNVENPKILEETLNNAPKNLSLKEPDAKLNAEKPKILQEKLNKNEPKNVIQKEPEKILAENAEINVEKPKISPENLNKPKNLAQEQPEKVAQPEKTAELFSFKTSDVGTLPKPASSESPKEPLATPSTAEVKNEVLATNAENAEMEADIGLSVPSTSTTVQPQQPTSSFFSFKLDKPAAAVDQASLTPAPIAQQQQNVTPTPATSPPIDSGGFFAGLGGAPKPESAAKNVFGSPFGGSFASSSPQAGSFGSLFGTPATTTTTTTTTSGGGTFGSSAWSKWPQQQQTSSVFGGGSGTGAFAGGSSGSVAQQGFGGFGSLGASPSTGTGPASAFGSPQSQTVSPVFGGKSTFGAVSAAGGSLFGASATFGGSPGFASPAGSSSTFGGSAFGASAFGGGGASPGPSGGFAAFAKGNAPSFGALAGGPSPSSGFGSLGGFGGASQQQQQSPQASASFSQWRG